MLSLEGTEYRPVELGGFWFGLRRLYLRKSPSSPEGTSRSRLGRSRLEAGCQLGAFIREVSLPPPSPHLSSPKLG